VRFNSLLYSNLAQVDSCGGSQDHATAFADYALFRDALNASKKAVFFSLCGWNDWYASMRLPCLRPCVLSTPFVRMVEIMVALLWGYKLAGASLASARVIGIFSCVV
jgi:hypothetical protein